MKTNVEVTPDLIVSAYRLFLAREPESEQVIRNGLQCKSVEELRQRFIESEEFSRTILRVFANRRFPLDLEQELPIDVHCDGLRLAQLFARVESTWAQLGREDPYWSVVTWEGFRQENFQQNAGSFWGGGKQDVARLFAWLQRNHVTPLPEWSCLEYGCGTGRVSPWLAKQFRHVIAVDISNPHLSIARGQWEQQHHNIHFRRIENIGSLDLLETFDVLFSIIVLQHNPPPVIAYILNKLFALIRPGGIAYFQLPTFSRGYHFYIDEYLASAASGMEMHVLPQRTIFEIARNNHCYVLEVQPDNLTGSLDMISNTFLFRKATQ